MSKSRRQAGAQESGKDSGALWGSAACPAPCGARATPALQFPRGPAEQALQTLCVDNGGDSESQARPRPGGRGRPGGQGLNRQETHLTAEGSAGSAPSGRAVSLPARAGTVAVHGGRSSCRARDRAAGPVQGLTFLCPCAPSSPVNPRRSSNHQAVPPVKAMCPRPRGARASRCPFNDCAGTARGTWHTAAALWSQQPRHRASSDGLCVPTRLCPYLIQRGYLIAVLRS